MIELIAFDLDGTILDDHKKISNKSKSILMEAQSKGLHLVITTGRPLTGISQIIRELNLTEGFSICFNGGMIVSNQNQEVVFKKGITGADVKRIYQVYQNDYVAISFYDQFGDIYANKENEVTAWNNSINHNRIHIIDPLTISDDAFYYKALLMGSESLINEAEKKANIFKTNLNVVRSCGVLLEFLNQEVSKGNALEALGSMLNVKKENMFAIGDEQNDISMISYAKYGIAMGNARECVKKEAYSVTDDNNHDGFYKALRKYL